MQDIIRKEFAGKTIIAIAHRLNTIMDFDRVIVMEAGKIVETGNPQKLRRTEGSLFKILVEKQGGV
jgi:ATP-binding cassette subfamily C (CFTR/MRP) protein 1